MNVLELMGWCATKEFKYDTTEALHTEQGDLKNKFINKYSQNI
jgi:hypothetical protein